jgi:hypothetical protein
MIQATLFGIGEPEAPRRLCVHTWPSVEFILQSCKRRRIAAHWRFTNLYEIELDCTKEQLEEVRREFNLRPIQAAAVSAWYSKPAETT